MAIKTFEIQFNPINSKNTFTNGDTMVGKVVLETTKALKIKSLVFIGKGRARVFWRETQGDKHHVYWANEKFYSVKHPILADTVFIGKGRHEFLFSFKIPERDMPSTFNSSAGKVIHKVKAELKQSLKLPKKAKAHFTFVSRSNMDGLQEPQSGCKDKGLSFGSGNVSLDVHTPKRGYTQGEALSFKVKLNNCSSCLVKPKFELYEKRSYFAQGHRKLEKHKILNGRIDDGSPEESGHLSKTITIPAQLAPSILNCSIIKLEYRLRIYLDFELAKDPEVKLPIVVLPLVCPEVIPPANTPDAVGNPLLTSFGFPQQPDSGFTWQLNSGYVQQPGSGFVQVPASGLGRQLSLNFPQQPGIGFAQQTGSGFAQQPGSGFPQQPGSGFPQQLGSGFPQQPGTGFPQPIGSGFPQQPGSGFPQQPGSGHARQLNSGFTSQPSLGFAQQPGSNFPQQPGSDFRQQPGSDFPQQPGSDFPQQPGSGLSLHPLDPPPDYEECDIDPPPSYREIEKQ